MSKTVRVVYYKLCPLCGTPFETSNVLKAYCTDRCGNVVRGRKFRADNPDKVLAKQVQDNSDVPKRMYYRVKSRAKRDNIPFDIGPEDIVIPTHCPVLGLELKFSNQGSGYHRDSPSLDKIHPALGYVKGNVRVISARANLLKNDATVEELKLILKDLEKLYQ